MSEAGDGKEAMRAAFLQKIEQGKLGLEFTQLQDEERFADLVNCLKDWETLTGGERAERTISILERQTSPRGTSSPTSTS